MCWRRFQRLDIHFGDGGQKGDEKNRQAVVLF
eukprot:COSAG05_NODE_18259_length_311_cov_0.726415_2_plen_31_part_01